MKIEQNEVVRMARECGLAEIIHGENNGYTTLETKFNPKRLPDFAAIVAEATKEKAAKVCEELGNEYALEFDRKNCAAAIRGMK